jgi:hypothetical protein
MIILVIGICICLFSLTNPIFLINSSDHVFFSEVRSRIRRAVTEIKERQQFYTRKLEKKRAAMGIPLMASQNSPPGVLSF